MKKQLSFLLLALAMALFLSPPIHAQVVSTGTITAQDAGTCATSHACVTLTWPLVAQFATVGVNVTGNGSANTLQFEGTVDGTTFVSVQAFPVAGGSSVTSTTGNGAWQVQVGGMVEFRVRCSTFVGGTVTVQLQTSQAPLMSGGGGGGGSGTVNSGTATHFAYYAGSGTAVSDMGADFVFGSHTITGGASAILDLHSASTLFYPVSAGCSSATTGSICYDTTNKNTHIWTNGADSIAAAEASAITSGYIPKSSSSTIGLLAASALNDGVTTANTLTYTGSGGIAASNGSITASGSIAAGSSCTPMGASAHGGVCMGENASTGWTPTSGFDYIRADSTLHGFEGSVNGGSEAPLVQGPTSSTAGYLAVFSNTTGNILKNGGLFSCTEVWGGSGTSFAMQSGDDLIVKNGCYNDSGVTRTIVAVKCRSDNASNSTTVNPTFGSDGTGTTILSGALTCGNSYAYSSSGTVSNASWTTGTGIAPGMATVGNATSIALIVEYHY